MEDETNTSTGIGGQGSSCAGDGIGDRPPDSAKVVAAPAVALAACRRHRRPAPAAPAAAGSGGSVVRLEQEMTAFVEEGGASAYEAMAALEVVDSPNR